MKTLIEFDSSDKDDIPARLREIADSLEYRDDADMDEVKLIYGDGIAVDPRLTLAAANLMMAFDLPQPAEESLAQMLRACLLHPGMTTADMGLSNPSSMNSISRDSMIGKALQLIEEVKAETK